MQKIYRFADVEVHCRERQLLVQGAPAPVGARAFDLLVALIERADRVVDKDELLAVVWPGVVVEEANIAVQISALRKLLGPLVLLTVPGRGYRFVGALEDTAAAAAAPGPLPDAKSEGGSLPLPDKPSIAVLPFLSQSADPEHRFFADGVTQDIVTGLSRFRSLFVISHAASAAYGDRSVGIDTLAEKLGVRYVVDGSVRREGQRVRVTAQLIDALSLRHIWSDHYDRVLEDIFAVQEDVTRSIVVAVSPEIRRAEMTAAARRRPSSLSAYQLALQALADVSRAYRAADTAALPAIMERATKALSIDPQSSLAMVTLSYAHWQQVFFRSASDLVQAWEESLRWAQRAIEADDTDSLGYVQRAMVLQHDPREDGRSIRYEEALHDLQIASELNPNDHTVLRLQGLTLAVAGRPDLGIQHLSQALRVNPHDPLVLSHLSLAHFFNGSYDEGVRCALQSLAKAPCMANTLMFLAKNHVGAGAIDKARAAWQAAHAIAPDYIDARTNGFTVYRLEVHRQRQMVFLRIAAGLEDPAAADGIR